MSMFKIIKPFWKSISFTLLLFYLSFARPASFADINVLHMTDKLAHYLFYVAFGLLLIYDYLKISGSNFSLKTFLGVCILAPIVLGGLIEIVQETFFKPRSAEWVDWLCDILGVFTAGLFFYFIKTKTDLLNKL